MPTCNSCRRTCNISDASCAPSANGRKSSSVCSQLNVLYEPTVQGGVESHDALSLQVTFRERALYIVALLRKMTCNLRHPMPLRHPVLNVLYEPTVELTCERFCKSQVEGERSRVGRQHSATYCNTLQHTATHKWTSRERECERASDTLQHTATHCNTI